MPSEIPLNSASFGLLFQIVFEESSRYSINKSHPCIYDIFEMKDPSRDEEEWVSASHTWKIIEREIEQSSGQAIRTVIPEGIIHEVQNLCRKAQAKPKLCA